MKRLLIYGVLILLWRQAAGQCPEDEYGRHWFGPRCDYLCHCRNGEACDVTTGECVSGCALGWMGPGCQYRDIAYSAFPQHLDNVQSGRWASRATDGDPNSCSETSDKKGSRTAGPWWRVYFSTDEMIRGVVITPKNGRINDFVRGFTVTVEQIPKRHYNYREYQPPQQNVQTCYQHTAGSPLNSTFEVYCDTRLIGNQVRIQLTTLDSQLTLCDIKVFGGRNVAIRKPADETSPLNPALLAVDGRTDTIYASQCSVTEVVDDPFWMVDLGQLYLVYTVELFAKNDGITNYQMEVKADMAEEWSVAHNDDDTWPPTRNVSLTESLRFLRVVKYATTTDLTICETRVFGDCTDYKCGLECSIVCHCQTFSYHQKVTGYCTSGCEGRWTGSDNMCNTECGDNEWGESCDLSCGHCLGSDPCDVRTGSCPRGCVDGYQSPACTQECENGYYGRGCGNICSNHCHGGVERCHHVTGICIDNCTVGWQGQKCDKECDRGYYGSGCSKPCSENCKSGAHICNHTNGSCYGGCNPGWTGDLCETVCKDGYYGEWCGRNCSSNCEGGFEKCHHVTGICTENCTAGWRSERCDQECGPGFYGTGCSIPCSENCKSNERMCNHVNGSCFGGCESGWMGDLCVDECEDGFYGEMCLQNCSLNCLGGFEKCHHVLGNCVHNCTAGWIGQRCDEACSPGFYGDDCGLPCSGHCNNDSTCNHVTGHCDPGCAAGWQGDRCDTVCSDGRHGINCGRMCGQCADGSVCHKVNGTCLQGCADNYHGVFCLQLNAGKQTSQAELPIAGIAGGAVAAVVVIAIVLVAVFLVTRRRVKRSSPDSSLSEHLDVNRTKSKRDHVYENSLAFKNFAEDEKNVTDDAHPEKAKESNDSMPENVYCNNTVPSRSAIYLSNLKEYVITNSETSKLSDEFKSIPYGPQYPTTAAMKPANRSKNRYRDMYPYDHSRVLLKTLPGQPDSDYINACFIDGYNKENAYIAAQGPTDKNVSDFWRMIWEQNVTTIVMVTNPTENGKMKCIEYWTDYDDDRFDVSVTSEETFEMMIVRTFKLTWASEPGSRTVHQYHFTVWPDKSTPDRATGLVMFHHRCRKRYASQDTPIVVHCSAGVGRTGTFIALDYLYEQGRDLGYVEVLDVVRNLRQRRVNAVQTRGQYIFLHEAVHEALVLPSTVTMSKFPETYAELLEINTKTQKVRLLEQYGDIQEVLLSQKVRNEMNEIKDEEDEFSAAKDPNNKERNRYDNILVANGFRPFLSTEVEGCTNYINAVLLQTPLASHGSLLSQSPLSCTAIDCCRLIIERNITCIVAFDDDQLESNERYLPRTGSLTIGPFQTQFVSEEDKREYTLYHHQIAFKGNTIGLSELVYKDWAADQRLPAGVNSFLRLVEAVQVIQRSSEGPILVHCLNGAEKSGLFVVLQNMLEQMRIDGDVTIPQTIRLARHRRQQIIPNYEQYKFCHDAVLQHIEENSTYANL